jgi:hypothetical protein
MLDSIHQYLDGFFPADGIARILQILGKSIYIIHFDQLHALVVQLLDVLPNLHPFLARLVVEVGSPVAEVTRDDEDGIRGVEVGGEKGPVLV